jgi:hypothetical protein
MTLYPPALAEIETQLKELPHVPEAVFACAVYFLIADDVVVYVGQTTNLYSRIGGHRDDKIWNRILFLPVPHEELDAIERHWIATLKPKFNSSPGQGMNRHRMEAAASIRNRITNQEPNGQSPDGDARVNSGQPLPDDPTLASVIQAWPRLSEVSKKHIRDTGARALVTDAWPDLPEAIKVGIFTMVSAWPVPLKRETK